VSEISVLIVLLDSEDNSWSFIWFVVMYYVVFFNMRVLISRKLCILTLLKWNNDSKSYVTCESVSSPVTFSEFEGHLSYFEPFLDQKFLKKSSI